MKKDIKTDLIKKIDCFGNFLDPMVGYARGTIITSSIEEARRRNYALRLVQERAKAKGYDSFYNFTGHRRDFLVEPEYVQHAEEWIGPAAYWNELVDLTKIHFGGNEHHDVAVFNRATAGIVSTCLALVKPDSKVISVVPGDRSHPSIMRGVGLAGGHLLLAKNPDQLDECFEADDVSLIIITGVNSELEVIEEALLLKAVKIGKKRGIPVFIDDAYGARLRSIIFGHMKSMASGADLAITACDKAGMGGPRAGLMIGRSELMEKIVSKAAELGLEARSPVAIGVWASLKKFDPDHLKKEVLYGKQIYEAACNCYGADLVKKSGIGASFSAETICKIVYCMRPELKSSAWVPAEITAALGMFLLKEYGIITVNALGQPGASIWVRLKPDPAELDRFGGISKLLTVLDQSLEAISKMADSKKKMEYLILGPKQDNL